MAPTDWENPKPWEDEPDMLENIWTIKNSFWLTLGSIMTQGCDILPKGCFSRMATTMWWFFALIMTSSYTANLAAFLTSEQSQSTIQNVDQLAKQSKVKYGCMEGGSTQEFFRLSNYSTYQKMWINMKGANPSVFVDGNPEGVKRVKTTRDGLYAYLMESTQLEYTTYTECTLRQLGGLLDSKSFGIAMPRKTGYAGTINNAVLKLTESGKIQELKDKWWKEKRTEEVCESEEEVASQSMALKRVGGVFLVLGSGLALAYVIAILEFLWDARDVSVEEHITYWEAVRQEMKFAFSFWITKKRVKTDKSSTSSEKNSRSSQGSNSSK